MTATSTTTPASERVRQIALPPDMRAMSTLPRIDYEDAFLVDVGPVGDRTAEEWARVVLEDAPVAVRTSLLSGWTALGLHVAVSRSDRSVLGWQVRRSTPDAVLLGAGSHLGLTGQLVFTRRGKFLAASTLVQLANPVARAAWVAVESVHVPVARHLLEQASRRSRP